MLTHRLIDPATAEWIRQAAEEIGGCISVHGGLADEPVMIDGRQMYLLTVEDDMGLAREGIPADKETTCQLMR